MKKTDLTKDWCAESQSSHAQYWDQSAGTADMKLSAFPKFVDRTAMSRFLVKHEIFNRIKDVQGSIVECGVHFGGGLFTWANLSTLYEPLNHRRRIIGFDTFEGFPGISQQDQPGKFKQAVAGGYKGGSVEDIEQATRLFDEGRPLSHIPKVEVVKGDFLQTADQYLADNPHLVISLLYLDFDIYAPTKKALEVFLPRMPKGAVVAFDQLNVEEWAGETVAFQEVAGIRNARLERMPFSSICWWQLD